MGNRRAEIAMTDEEVDAFLRAGRTMVLVTTGPDGAPDPLPMWFLVDADGRVVMRTFARSQKVVNLRRDPRCAVLVETGSTYAELRGVQLTGRMELLDDVDLVLDVFTGLLRKYEGVTAEQAAEVRARSGDYARKQVVLRLAVERTVSWDHRKLGGETPVPRSA